MIKNDLLEAYGYGRGMRYRLPAKSTNMFGLDLSISGDNTICQVTSSANNSASSDANSASNSASSDANSASPKKKRMPKEELKSHFFRKKTIWSVRETSSDKGIVFPSTHFIYTDRSE